MKILMVASEATPFSKTGGLADVAGSLPQALARQGEDVAVLVPKYKPPVDRAPKIPRTRVALRKLTLRVGPHSYPGRLEQVNIGGARYFLLDCPALYYRPSIYTMDSDEHIRFAALAQAAFVVSHSVFPPDIFHCHDWHAGLLPAFLKDIYRTDPVVRKSKSVFTIHNLAYQGNFPRSVMRDLGLSAWMMNHDGLEFWDQVSFMKAALVYSDAITTVSPTYAREIQTEQLGSGMQDTLQRRQRDLHGILNGVDYQVWNPETDPFIKANYSLRELEGKRACKLALLDELGLPRDMGRPLIGIVSRFAEQKGFALLKDIAGWLMSQNVTLAVLGSGDPEIESMFRNMHAAHPDKIALGVGYNDPLAHRIEAGADMFLMPSRYEPCGLNQIYSLKYGTVPIVHATGGLEDTVDEETGFKFRHFSADALAASIDEALSAFPSHERWVERMRAGMQKDFSWDNSAKVYQELYCSLLEK